MSKKSEAMKDFRAAAKAAAGAHLTVQARMATAERLVETLYERGYQVRDVNSLGTRHLQAYVDERKDENISTRTLQNEMSHIRGLLRAAGREDLAANKVISNIALAVGESCRDGTKTAATDEQYRDAVAAMADRDAGLAAVLRLERELGLRSQEAIRSGPSLATWERQIAAGEKVSVTFGTKGGRPREVLPVDRARALAAVREARQVAETRGGKLLQGTLRQASTTYRNAMHRHAEIDGHQLRYAWARERVDGYRQAGYSVREALALTSIDLGHGDGRGRYVAQVYLR